MLKSWIDVRPTDEECPLLERILIHTDVGLLFFLLILINFCPSPPKVIEPDKLSSFRRKVLELFKLELLIYFSSMRKSGGFGDTLCYGIICDTAFSCLSSDV